MDDQITGQSIAIPQWSSLTFQAASAFGGFDAGENIRVRRCTDRDDSLICCSEPFTLQPSSCGYDCGA
eukprot:4984302-Pleurochrysis_carterae.AAC.1